MSQEGKINRQVHFMYGPMLVLPQKDTNNTWIYDRAPEGYKFILNSIQCSMDHTTATAGIIQIYDGHEYTHWLTFPGVESKELLARVELSTYMENATLDLYNWECKEFTLSVRSRSETYAFKCCLVVWYYLERMSKLEEYYYACIQPKGDLPIRKGGASTIEQTEA